MILIRFMQIVVLEESIFLARPEASTMQNCYAVLFYPIEMLASSVTFITEDAVFFIEFRIFSTQIFNIGITRDLCQNRGCGNRCVFVITPFNTNMWHCLNFSAHLIICGDAVKIVAIN